MRLPVNSNLLGAALLLLAVGASVARVLTVHREHEAPGRTVLRIAHWQLELGYRDALQAAIDEYEALHPDIHVVQIPVSGQVYAQWLNTHLIGGTAPDLAQMGGARLTNEQQYVARFFLPLTGLIDQPNPYNAGTDLETVPWRETFFDAMRGGWRDDLQDYFAVPTATFTMRLAYNKNLLREATGSDAPPATFGRLLEQCAAIRALGRRTGRSLVPIAGNQWTVVYIESLYITPLSAGYEPALDADLDGQVTPLETYMGYVAGKVSLQDPAVRGGHELLRRMAREFPDGFVGMAGDQRTFLFVQGRAGMAACGAWDARTFSELADFEVGFCEFPLPGAGAGEPWGGLVDGRASEARTLGAGSYGIAKTSRHVDEAVDFLRFLTSRKVNERYNATAGFLPVVLGAQPAPMMRPFAPRGDGHVARLDFRFGAQASQIITGENWRYLAGEIDYDSFARAADAALLHPAYGGDAAWALECDTVRRNARAMEQVLAVQSLRMVLDPAAADAPVKFRAALQQQVRLNDGNDMKRRFRLLRGREMPAP